MRICFKMKSQECYDALDNLDSLIESIDQLSISISLLTKELNKFLLKNDKRRPTTTRRIRR